MADLPPLGPNIQLIPLAENFLDKARAWVNDPYIKKTILRVSYVSEEDQLQWFDALTTDPAKKVFAIIFREGGNHIGNTGLYHIDYVHGRAEFWLYIGDSSYRERGLGAEVLSLMQEYAFSTLKLHKLYLFVGANNIAAINLYKKMKFSEDGLLREHYCIEGQHIDVLAMSILRGEYFEEK